MQFYALKRKKGIWYNLIILGILCQQKIEGEKYVKILITINQPTSSCEFTYIQQSKNVSQSGKNNQI